MAELDNLRALRDLVMNINARRDHESEPRPISLEEWIHVVGAAVAALPCRHRFVALKYTTDGKPAACCTTCGEKVAEVVVVDLERTSAPRGMTLGTVTITTLPQKCEVDGCDEPPEANLKRCRGHEGGFMIGAKVDAARRAIWQACDHPFKTYRNGAALCGACHAAVDALEKAHP